MHNSTIFQLNGHCLTSEFHQKSVDKELFSALEICHLILKQSSIMNELCLSFEIPFVVKKIMQFFEKRHEDKN